MQRSLAVVVALTLSGCSQPPAGSPAETPDPTATPTATPVETPPPAQLEVRFMGVGGFFFRYGGEAVMTAPLFTNPDYLAVTVGDIAANHAVIDQFLGDITGTKAILSGHAHYDHLMDVPYVWTKTDDAMVYGNLSAKRILNGFAPDPGPSCAAPAPDAPWARIPQANVVALDDPQFDVVDYRSCQGMETCGAQVPAGEGAWVLVPDSHIRFRALCSAHPDQVFVIHFGEGCMDADQCSPPPKAPDWKEGQTVAFLIDFLDPETGDPKFRIYYQDAPFDAPISYPQASLLAEKAVDVAIVNGGNWEQVPLHPIGILDALSPRFAVLGHWEGFFAPQDEPVEPLPFLDVAEIETRMESAMPTAPGDSPRWARPMPGDQFLFREE